VTYSVLASPLGPIYAAFSPAGLTRLDFGRHMAEAIFVASLPRPARRIEPAEHPVARQLAQELARYFLGSDPPFRAPLDLSAGRPFQRRVWEALRRIPFGRTASYGEVARRIGRPGAARAVGQAVGANPVPVVVPCHRVICTSRALGGFGSGLRIKHWLLRHERSQ
jgi:O-6-methylguanine DNA methyltransferase